MGFTVFNQYKGNWVLSSAAKVSGGGTIDVEPVQVIELPNTRVLATALQRLVAEEHQIVPEPDWNDRRFAVGIRADAVGAKTWRAFTKDARAFKLEQNRDGLLLEEWPRERGSFSAKAAWVKQFPSGAFVAVADYVVDLTKQIASKRRST